MSQKEAPKKYLPIEGRISNLLARIAAKDKTLFDMVHISQKEFESDILKQIAPNNPKSLATVMSEFGFKVNFANQVQMISGDHDDGFVGFQVGFKENLRAGFSPPANYEESLRIFSWNREKNGNEVFTITALKDKQIISARYENGHAQQKGNGTYILTKVDITAKGDVKGERYPLDFAGIILKSMLIKADSMEPFRVYDIDKPLEIREDLMPKFIPLGFGGAGK